MRVQILRRRLPSGSLGYRVCEADRQPVSRWLPLEPLLGALDQGGFDCLRDARAFALGIDRVRAEAGLVDLTERAELDTDRRFEAA
jgi:hypothetical protein